MDTIFWLIVLKLRPCLSNETADQIGSLFYTEKYLESRQFFSLLFKCFQSQSGAGGQRRLFSGNLPALFILEVYLLVFDSADFV